MKLRGGSLLLTCEVFALEPLCVPRSQSGSCILHSKPSASQKPLLPHRAPTRYSLFYFSRLSKPSVPPTRVAITQATIISHLASVSLSCLFSRLQGGLLNYKHVVFLPCLKFASLCPHLASAISQVFLVGPSLQGPLL